VYKYPLKERIDNILLMKRRIRSIKKILEVIKSIEERSDENYELRYIDHRDANVSTYS